MQAVLNEQKQGRLGSALRHGCWQKPSSGVDDAGLRSMSVCSRACPGHCSAPRTASCAESPRPPSLLLACPHLCHRQGPRVRPGPPVNAPQAAPRGSSLLPRSPHSELHPDSFPSSLLCTGCQTSTEHLDDTAACRSRIDTVCSELAHFANTRRLLPDTNTRLRPSCRSVPTPPSRP